MRHWTWTDAWILAATALAQTRDGATPAEIIGAADGIHHAIPTTEELSQAFSRLAACGLVQTKHGRYAVAPRRSRAVRQALEGPGSLSSAVERCLRWLADTGPEPREAASVRVSEAEVRTAYERHCASLQRRPGPAR